MRAVDPPRARMIGVLFVLLLLALLPAAVGGTGEEPKSGAPLGEQLEGIAPGPRIAYLRHLLASGRDDCEVSFQLGVAFHESGETDSALHYYRRAADLDPSFSKAYVNMGVLWDERRHPSEALVQFDKAIEARPDDLLAHAYAASVLLSLRRYEDAWKHLDRALEIDPLDPRAHYYLADLFWASGMFRETLAEWELVIELAPGDPLAQQAERNIGLLQRVLTGNASSGEALPWERR